MRANHTVKIKIRKALAFTRATSSSDRGKESGAPKHLYSGSKALGTQSSPGVIKCNFLVLARMILPIWKMFFEKCWIHIYPYLHTKKYMETGIPRNRETGIPGNRALRAKLCFPQLWHYIDSFSCPHSLSGSFLNISWPPALRSIQPFKIQATVCESKYDNA